MQISTRLHYIIVIGSQGYLVGIATSGRSGNRFPLGTKNFSHPKNSTEPTEPTQSPTQCEPRFLPGGKAAGA